MNFAHLPPLQMEVCEQVFEAAGLTTSDVADLIGASRVTMHYWKTGRSTPNKNTMSRVSTLAHFAAHAVRHKKLPIKDMPRLRHLRMIALQRTLYDAAAMEALSVPQVTVTATA